MTLYNCSSKNHIME